jgi:carbon storage regulator
MLALTRKIGERIVIGDNIVITVVDVKGDNIRLGIDAPKEIKVYRGEIFDAIAMENKDSAVANNKGILTILGDLSVEKFPKQ